MTHPLGPVWLVRHAMPALDESADPARWQLGTEGLVAAAKLRARLPQDAVLIASDEPKAWQTVDPVGYRVVRDPRLGEVRRVEPFDDDYRSRRLAYVTGTDHPDWEPRAEVAARFDAAITLHRRRADGRPLVAATHGMAMTVWLTSIGVVTDPGAFWSGLQLPDVIDVGLTP